MGPRALVSVTDAVATIEEYIDHFKDGKYPAWSSDVWKKMSNSLKNKWSASNIYNNVIQNRRKIMEIACKNQNLPFIPFSSKLYCDNDELLDRNSSDDAIDNSKDVDYDVEDEACGLDEFEVRLLRNEWESIQSSDIVYKDRNYSILKRGTWGDVLSVAIYRSTKLPCAYSVKNAKIFHATESKHYLRIRAYCRSKSCGNFLFGYLYEKPPENSDVILTVRTKETYWNAHEPVERHLKGKKRQQIGEKAFHEGTANLRKRLVRENTGVEGKIPPYVPNSAAISKAKNEFINRALDIKPSDGKDLINTIERMSVSGPYAGCIHEVKRKKLYVSFCSSMQTHTYKKYCKTTKKASSISIDGTGSIVQPVVHEDGTSSGHIFLYSVTINFNNSILSVYDMFTESQDTEIIIYWLRKWLTLKVPKPQEVVCDSSRALMNGISQAFNYQTVKAYVETCFLYAIGHEEYQHRPAIYTYLRLDVAHYMAKIRRWNCFKYLLHPKIRHFYLYCVGLLIDCQNIKQFDFIFQLMCFVGLTENEDAVNKKLNMSVLEARNKLEELIANRNFDINFKILESEETIADNGEKNFIEEVIDTDKTNQENGKLKGIKNPSRIKSHIDKLFEEATVLSFCGSKPNICFFVEFIQQFKNEANEFPLWSNSALPILTGHATTCYAEGNFNIVKHNTFRNYKLPIRIDKALKIILNDYIGNAIEVDSKLTEFYQANGRYPEPQMKQSIFSIRCVTDSNLESNKKNSQFNDNNSQDTDCCSDIEIDTSPKKETNPKDFSTAFNNVNYKSEKNINEGSFTTNNTNDWSQQNKNQNSFMAEKTNGNNQQNDKKEISTAKITKTTSQREKSKQIPKGNVKRTKGYYFEPNTKIPKLFEPPVTIQELPLLFNGGRITNPAVIQGQSYFSSNTCGFDSIVQIFVAIGLDDSSFLKYIQASNNRILKFVNFVIVNKTIVETYEQRIVLLKDIYAEKIIKITKLNSYMINLYTHLHDIYKLGFKTLPSGSYSFICLTCGTYTTPVTILQLTTEKIIKEKGFGALQEALIYEWQDVPCIKKCKRLCRRKLNVFNSQVFIELDVRDNLEAITGMKGKLSDFSLEIKLNNEKYRLAGVIERVPLHFISYCRRVNGRWDLCDDMKNEVCSVSSKKSVEPHGVIYVKASLENDESIENVNGKEHSKILTDLFSLDECTPPITSNDVDLSPITPLDDSDTVTRDNWRNKEKVHEFFFNDTLTSDGSYTGHAVIQKITILQNGAILPSVTVQNDTFNLSDTSNFDCIIQIMSTSAVDFNDYLNSLKNSPNKTMKFTLDFIELECSMKIHEKRALLLKSLNYSTEIIHLIQNGKKNKTSIYQINIVENIANTWETCLTNEVSVYHTYGCESCGSCTFMTPTLKVDSKVVIQYGFKALDKAVIYHKTLKKVKCRENNCAQLCTVTAYPNFHIFIELDIINKDNKCLDCPLEDLPTSFYLGADDKYILTGVIASSENRKVAYCFRLNGNWELYDGYSDSIQAVDESTVVTPVGAIYILG